MESIAIDPSTGYVSTSSMLLTPATPKLHPNSVNRAIKRTLSLETYGGPMPIMIKIGGKRMLAAPIDTCAFILDNIAGQKEGNKCKWDLWRETSRHASFKRVLREHVERVLASRANGGREQQSPSQPEQRQQSQEQQGLLQPRLEQPEPDQRADEVETKAVILQKALRAINIVGSVRIDETSGKASIIDAIKLLCPDKNEDYATKALRRIIAKDDEEQHESGLPGLQGRVALSNRIEHIQIIGEGIVTPVGDAKTIVEIIWLLPSGAAKEFRRQSAETITRVLGGDVTLCEEIEQHCACLQITAEGLAYQQFMVGEQPQAKKARFGPPAMMHATDEDYETFVKMEVNHELAVRNSQHAHELAMRNDQHAHELTTVKTKYVREQLQEEVGIVLAMKGAFEAIRPLDDTQKIELYDKMSDIQYRIFRKLGETTVVGGGVAAGEAGTLALATAVADASHVDPVDPGHGVATPQCHESVRGDEISIAQISGYLGIRLGSLAGQVGKRMKALYTAQYGAVAGDNIPKRTTRYNGKPFSENVYYARDRGIMEQAIREVARS